MKRPMLVLAVALTGLASVPAFAAGGLSPGVYVTKITGATPAVLNSSWRLALKGNRFTTTRNNKPAVAGVATITGSKISFHDLSGPYRCTGSQAIGSYHWYLRGTGLTFRVVRDACSGRKAILTNGFTKTG